MCMCVHVQVWKWQNMLGNKKMFIANIGMLCSIGLDNKKGESILLVSKIIGKRPRELLPLGVCVCEHCLKFVFIHSLNQFPLFFFFFLYVFPINRPLCFENVL